MGLLTIFSAWLTSFNFFVAILQNNETFDFLGTREANHAVLSDFCWTRTKFWRQQKRLGLLSGKQLYFSFNEIRKYCRLFAGKYYLGEESDSLSFVVNFSGNMRSYLRNDILHYILVILSKYARIRI